MAKNKAKPGIKSQLYDRLEISLTGLNWFIFIIVVALLLVVVLALLVK